MGHTLEIGPHSPRQELGKAPSKITLGDAHKLAKMPVIQGLAPAKASQNEMSSISGIWRSMPRPHFHANQDT